MASGQSLEHGTHEMRCRYNTTLVEQESFGLAGPGNKPGYGRSQLGMSLLGNVCARYRPTSSNGHCQGRCPWSEKVTLGGAGLMSHIIKHVHVANLIVVLDSISCERSENTPPRFMRRKPDERKTGF